MVDIVKKIEDLSKIYYWLVNLDHHKDTDCHFWIEHVVYFESWSYGKYLDKEEEYFKVVHYGYVSDDINEIFPTLQSAREFLYNKLKQIILSEVKSNLNIANSNIIPDNEFYKKHEKRLLEIKEKIEKDF